MAALQKAGYTLDEVRRFRPEVWAHDWRWTKNKSYPTLNQVRSELQRCARQSQRRIRARRQQWRAITDSLKRMSLPSGDNGKSADGSAQPQTTKTPETCPICSRIGWVMLDVPRSDARWNKAIPCQCKRNDYLARRARKLQAVDGLREGERRLRFAGLDVTPANREAIVAVNQATAAQRGIVTLIGPVGTGKTSLLICAVNEAREAGSRRFT